MGYLSEFFTTVFISLLLALPYPQGIILPVLQDNKSINDFDQESIPQPFFFPIYLRRRMETIKKENERQMHRNFCNSCFKLKDKYDTSIK